MQKLPEQMTPTELYEFWQQECERLLPQPIRSDNTLQYLDLCEMPEPERNVILEGHKDVVNHLIECLVMQSSSTAQIAVTLRRSRPEPLIVYWWRLGNLFTLLGDAEQNDYQIPLSPSWSAFLRASLVRQKVDS